LCIEVLHFGLAKAFAHEATDKTFGAFADDACGVITPRKFVKDSDAAEVQHRAPT